MSLGIIDYVFLGIIFLFAIVAAIKGFVKAIFGKLCWIIGILGAFLLFGYLSPVMQNYISNPTLAAIVSFAILFIVVFVVIKIIEVIISKIFSGEILKGLDKALGFLFGIAEGFAVVFALVFILTQQPWFDVSEITANSAICSWLAPFASQTQKMIKEAA